MDCQVLVVGGGMAGLTAAAYLSQAGLDVLLCEKETKVGGLVNSFDYNGFTFDGGIRAMENSGIVLPMLRQLGIDIPFVSSAVSIGIEKDVTNLQSKDSLKDYLNLLSRYFPDNSREIEQFGAEIKKIMQYMDILYGIDNPLFLDLKSDPGYLVKTILPWLIKYILTVRKIGRLNEPVDDYLKKITDNQALIDMIAQHFFKNTPTFFALSYFSLYLDYQYPRGGTGVLAEKMRQFIREHNGRIRCETEIVQIDPSHKQVRDAHGVVYQYQKLIWCADLKRLYQAIDPELLLNPKTAEAVRNRKIELSDKIGGDSILTLYLTLDMDPQYFKKIANAHFFYTPVRAGLNSLASDNLLKPAVQDGKGLYTDDLNVIKDWLARYFQYTTYEISCPALRDSSLAPAGKTGLIISTLFDYPLVRHLAGIDWYDAFKTFSAQAIISVLDASIFPGLKEHIIDQFVSTPLTLERLTGNSDGAITGWAFTNSSMPAVHSMPKIAKSVLTQIPDVYQAGQWTFSPSGLPISILTGKLAADQVIKKLKQS
ncbi:MAG: NAD(P)/FAD-dependent oxidoreductase [Bacillota bacterium]|nr:NAD(P)/FAD-dependent oxidoreductase [Bacillota bacterium]